MNFSYQLSSDTRGSMLKNGKLLGLNRSSSCNNLGSNALVCCAILCKLYFALLYISYNSALTSVYHYSNVLVSTGFDVPNRTANLGNSFNSFSMLSMVNSISFNSSYCTDLARYNSADSC